MRISDELNRQATPDLEKLKNQAQMTVSRLRQFGDALALELGRDPDMDFLIAPLKKDDRIYEKVIEKYDGDPSRVTDITRGRILFDRPEQVEQFRKLFANSGKNRHQFLKSWEKKGIEVLEVKDYFASPKDAGYVGVNFKVRVELSKGRYHICELQLMHQNMQHTDSLSHEIFEEIRSLKAKTAEEDRDFSDEEQKLYEQLVDVNRTIYRRAIRENGLTSLVPESGHVHERLFTQSPRAPVPGVSYS